MDRGSSLRPSVRGRHGPALEDRCDQVTAAHRPTRVNLHWHQSDKLRGHSDHTPRTSVFVGRKSAPAKIEAIYKMANVLKDTDNPSLPLKQQGTQIYGNQPSTSQVRSTLLSLIKFPKCMQLFSLTEVNNDQNRSI